MGKSCINKMWTMGLLLAVSLTGCGSDNGGGPSAGSAAGSGASAIGSVSTEAAAVPLGTAANYVILAKTGADTKPISVVTGNVGVSPIARVGLTGWSETYDATDTFATSAQVVLGKLYAADNVGGTTKVDLTTAVANMETAYTAAAAKTAGVGPFLNLGGGTVTGQTLTPGVYTWGTAVTIPTDLILSGSATDVWVFQVAGALDMAAAKNVTLIGGAQAKNVFWQVAGAVNIGANTQFKGIILGQTSITLGNKASLNGRLLAQTAVNLDANTVTVP